MINRFLKIIPINNSYLRFIFLTRHLSIIIFLSIVVIFSSPKFFSYDEKFNEINEFLKENYKIEILKYNKIKYKIIPTPGLLIDQIEFNSINNLINANNGELFLRISVKDIYQKVIKIKKIYLKNSQIKLKISNYKNFLTYLSSIDEIINIKDSNLEIFENDISLVEINNFSFISDNKFNKKLRGEYLNQKISLNYLNKAKKNYLDFRIKDIGLKIRFTLLKKIDFENYRGNSLIRILDNNLSFDFIIDDKIKIFNSNFRNNKIKTSFDGLVNYKPFLDFDLIFNIGNFDKKVIKNDLIKLLKNRDFLKKFNGNFKINYSAKNIKRKQIFEKLLLNVNLQNGEVFFDNSSIIFKGGNMFFDAFSSEYKDVRKLNFNLVLNIDNRKKFLKNFSLKEKKIANQINVEGFFFLKSNRVQINKININKKDFNSEELEYYQKNFQELVVQDSLLNIISENKFKNFIKEIY